MKTNRQQKLQVDEEGFRPVQSKWIRKNTIKPKTNAKGEGEQYVPKSATTIN